MKIVLIGGVKFSAVMLEQLLNLPDEVVGVCTKESRFSNSDQFDLGPLAIQHEIPFKHVADVNDTENLEWIASLEPDLICCFGWSQLLGTRLLGIPHNGVIGFHPAALPSNRGRHPIIWALALGLTETASTFFLMDEGADSGDIVSQRYIAIDEDDDAGTLYGKITATAASQVQEFIPNLSHGNVNRVTQDHSKANYWRKRTHTDGRIDWRMSNTAIHNLVRALTVPYSGAHFDYKDQQVKVWRAEIVEEPMANLEPGLVLAVDFGLIIVKTGRGAIRLLAMEPAVDIKVGDYL